MSSSPSWTTQITTPASAGKSRTPAKPSSGGTARPAAARTPRTCPAARSAPARSGKIYTAPDGKTFRPSMFLTLTCDSYGKVGQDGTRRPRHLRL